MFKRIFENFVRKYDLDTMTKGEDRVVVDIGAGYTPHKDANFLIDYNPAIKKAFPELQVIIHDINKLPLPLKDSSVDYIYLHNILEHIKVGNDALFREMLRVLKNYGKLNLQVPNSYHIYHRLMYFIGIIPVDFVIAHKRHHSYQQLKDDIVNNGFEIFELRNLWMFNPLRNFTNPQIKILAKKIDAVENSINL